MQRKCETQSGKNASRFVKRKTCAVEQHVVNIKSECCEEPHNAWGTSCRLFATAGLPCVNSPKLAFDVSRSLWNTSYRQVTTVWLLAHLHCNILEHWRYFPVYRTAQQSDGRSKWNPSPWLDSENCRSSVPFGRRLKRLSIIFLLGDASVSDLIRRRTGDYGVSTKNKNRHKRWSGMAFCIPIPSHSYVVNSHSFPFPFPNNRSVVA